MILKLLLGCLALFLGQTNARMTTEPDIIDLRFTEENGNCSVSVISPSKIRGELRLEGFDLESGETIDGGVTKSGSMVVPHDKAKAVRWTASFTDKKTGQSISKSFIPKYILTPAAPKSPRYNGPSVFGVRPGSPIILRLAFSGERPMSFSVEGLPEGAVIDAREGILGGKVSVPGDYNLTLVAENEFGTCRQPFTLRVGPKIALTPPMGWNSWNCWGLTVSQEKVISSASAILLKGLADYGYNYITIHAMPTAASLPMINSRT